MIGPLGTEIRNGRRPVPSIQAVPPTAAARSAPYGSVSTAPQSTVTEAGSDKAVPAPSPTDFGESGRDPIPAVIRSGNDSGAEHGAPRTAAP